MSFSSSSGGKSSFLNYYELVERGLEPGDLIEIDRGAYNHWAMFSHKSDNGTHWCFHVTTMDGGDFDKKGAMMASGRKAIASLKKHKLKDILEDNDSKKPSQARINNKIDEAKRKKCAPRPIEEVIEHLEKLKDEPVAYHLADSNCEHYVTNWKYGARWSRQVEVVQTSTIITVAVATAALVGGLVFGIFGRGTASKHGDDSDSDDLNA